LLKRGGGALGEPAFQLAKNPEEVERRELKNVDIDFTRVGHIENEGGWKEVVGWYTSLARGSREKGKKKGKSASILSFIQGGREGAEGGHQLVGVLGRQRVQLQREPH